MRNVIVLLFSFISLCATADMIPSVGIIKKGTSKMSVLNCTSKRRCEKSGEKGSSRTITDYYTITFQKECDKCQVFHIVKSYGDYETTVNGSINNRPSYVYAESVRTGVEKDSTLYCHSVTEATNIQSVAIDPLVERQSYAYSYLSTGKGIGRPKRKGYIHIGFIILVTWPGEMEQVFSDMPEIRDKFKLEGNVFLTDFLKNLTLCGSRDPE